MTRYIDPNVTRGVNIGFTAIMIPALAVFMCISFYRARRNHDPARDATKYFKAMLPLAILYVKLPPRWASCCPGRLALVSCGQRTVSTDFINRWLLMYMIQGILSIVYEQGYAYYYSGSIYEASLRMSLLGTLFSYITNVLLIVTLAEVGNGFLFCLAQTRTGLQKAVRYAALASCIILSVLAIAIFGVYNAVYSSFLSDRWSGYFDDSLQEASKRMNAAFNILTFVWAFLLLVFGVVVFNKTKRNYILKNVSCVLFLLQHCQDYRQKGNQPQHFLLLLTHTIDPVRNSLPRRHYPEFHYPAIRTHLPLRLYPCRHLPVLILRNIYGSHIRRPDSHGLDLHRRRVTHLCHRHPQAQRPVDHLATVDGPTRPACTGREPECQRPGRALAAAV